MHVEKKQHWSVDKRVPLALIFTFVIGFFGYIVTGVQWVGTITARADAAEKRIDVIEKKGEDVAKTIQDVSDRTIRQEAQLDAMYKMLDRIDRRTAQDRR